MYFLKVIQSCYQLVACIQVLRSHSLNAECRKALAINQQALITWTKWKGENHQRSIMFPNLKRQSVQIFKTVKHSVPLLCPDYWPWGSSYVTPQHSPLLHALWRPGWCWCSWPSDWAERKPSAGCPALPERRQDMKLISADCRISVRL